MVDQPSRSEPSCDPSGSASYRAAIYRFDQERVAKSYPGAYGSGWRDRREMSSIRRALANVPRGAEVLDLPCGSGRLLELLVDSGYRVTCADRSEYMLEMTRRRWDALRSTAAADATGAGTASVGAADVETPAFVMRDVMQTAFADRQFDAVICNRLFHHLSESDARIRALAELRRISRGPVVVSFFNAFSFGSLKFRIKHLVRRTSPEDRIPIPAWRFLNEVRRAGLTPVHLHAVAWGISPLWYVVGIPVAGRTAELTMRLAARRPQAG